MHVCVCVLSDPTDVFKEADWQKNREHELKAETSLQRQKFVKFLRGSPSSSEVRRVRQNFVRSSSEVRQVRQKLVKFVRSSSGLIL